MEGLILKKLRSKINRISTSKPKDVDFNEIGEDEDSLDSEFKDNLGSIFCSKYKLDDAPIGVDNIEQESEYLADMYKEFS